MQDSLAFLRENTRAYHQTLDRLPLLQSIAKGQFTIASYVGCLHGFYLVYDFIEPVLATYEKNQHFSTPSYTYRTPWLLEDLRKLSIQPPSISLSPHIAFDVNDMASYWGVRYVLDGSSMGAKFIWPRVAKKLETFHSVEDSLFWRNLAGLSESWCTIKPLLNASLTDDGERLMASQNAIKTFQLFIDVMQSVGEQNQLNKEIYCSKECSS